MTVKIVVGVDGEGTGDRALDYAKELAGAIGDCELLVVYVIEWSPYSFNTPEENEQRHKRREEEIASAQASVIEPTLASLKEAGVAAEGVVRHGNVADVLIEIAAQRNAVQIVVGRVGASGLKSLIFGSVTSKLVQVADVPVTVVP